MGEAGRGLGLPPEPVGELRVVAANPDLADKFRGGKRGVLGALVGQVMRETRGRANPKLVSDLLERAIGG